MLQPGWFLDPILPLQRPQFACLPLIEADYILLVCDDMGRQEDEEAEFFGLSALRLKQSSKQRNVPEELDLRFDDREVISDQSADHHGLLIVGDGGGFHCAFRQGWSDGH